MKFDWFQKIFISILITWVLFQMVLPLFQWGFLEAKFQPIVYLGTIAIICFGILLTKFCNTFILLTSFILITQTFYDLGLDSYIVSSMFALAIGIAIYGNNWQRWTKFVLRRTLLASGFAFQICVYFSSYTNYTATELFIAWLPVMYFIFHMRIPVLIFVVLPNYFIGDFLLNYIPSVWLTPTYFIMMVIVSNILNKLLKKHPSDWTVDRYRGSRNPSRNDEFTYDPGPGSTSEPEREKPPGYYDVDFDTRRQSDAGQITDMELWDKRE